ncbi:MAG: ADP-ribosylation/crystallin J1 [Prochloraceae cyanobacterium]|nr:ADP-ribosylation/crystallin J1 [Prochloraceae cyanobacterium]
MLLYRPIGLKELELIAKSGFKKIPTRLPEQPIFYPVLNFEYAEKIARDWNTKANIFAGFVTKFKLEKAYIKKYEIRQVGNQIHQELWVAAEELEEFNSHIIGKITIEAAYYGEKFSGAIDPVTNLPKSIDLK